MSKDIQVLFVDQEMVVAKLVENLFRDEPYGVLLTANPDEAREALTRENIRLVICAHRPPALDGIQFLKEVRDRHPGTVRMLSATESDFPAAAQAGAEKILDRFIRMPFQPDELGAAVRQALRLWDLLAERKRLDNEAKKIDLQYKDQKDVTYAVSHELRTPLASIKAAIDLVAKEFLGPINQKQNDVLKRAQESIDHLKTLTDEILDLTKLEEGKLKMNIKMNNINLTVKEIANTHRKVAEEKKLYIKTKLDKNIPSIPYDHGRIVQVLDNILNNAIKYTDKGGVTIFSKQDSDNNQILISIRDSGRGIAEENFSAIFEKFQRVESGDDPEEGGTGLGMAISREIIQSHMGKIWVESKLGKGTTFHFTLPMEQTAITKT